MRGKKGTTVTLNILHPEATEPVDIVITRDVIDIPTIETETKEGIFIIRLYNFSAISANQFRGALREFINSKSDKLILDLRGNPGGYLEAAVDMASWFLPAGKVVVRENFGTDTQEEVIRSKGYDVFNENLKFVVLVNGGSASASEILAGALQEHGKAKLVGTKTYGKGSVQELVSVTPETSLKVTIAQWMTPNGISISANGLKPDFEIPMTLEEVKSGNDVQLKKAIDIIKNW
jgi:carboxyl-terminal processing protease